MMPIKPLAMCAFALAAFLFGGDARSQTRVIVALGDSNTAGFGVSREEAFPAQLESMLRGRGYDVRVSNAGISGDTTSGMLARVDSVAPQGTQIVLVQGGYNDLRRGSSAAEIMGNVDAILARLRARRIKVVLCGFYDQPWAAIARKYGAVYVPGDTCYDSRYRGFDGLHMNAAGHGVVAVRLLPVMERLLPPRARAGCGAGQSCGREVRQGAGGLISDAC